MSTREQCNAILDTFDESQLVNAAAIPSMLKKTIDDLQDEAFCEEMMRDCENDPDKGDPMPIEDFARELGIDL